MWPHIYNNNMSCMYHVKSCMYSCTCIIYIYFFKKKFIKIIKRSFLKKKKNI